jgi:hypothetical protein
LTRDRHRRPLALSGWPRRAAFHDGQRPATALHLDPHLLARLLGYPLVTPLRQALRRRIEGTVRLARLVSRLRARSARHPLQDVPKLGRVLLDPSDLLQHVVQGVEAWLGVQVTVERGGCSQEVLLHLGERPREPLGSFTELRGRHRARHDLPMIGRSLQSLLETPVHAPSQPVSRFEQTCTIIPTPLACEMGSVSPCAVSSLPRE